MIFVFILLLIPMFFGLIIILFVLKELLTPKSVKEARQKEQERLAKEAKEEGDNLLRQKIIKEELIRQEVRDKLKKEKTIG